jgi:hypothetical protein
MTEARMAIDKKRLARIEQTRAALQPPSFLRAFFQPCRVTGVEDHSITRQACHPGGTGCPADDNAMPPNLDIWSSSDVCRSA